jgi:hypothetical protein
MKGLRNDGFGLVREKLQMERGGWRRWWKTIYIEQRKPNAQRRMCLYSKAPFGLEELNFNSHHINVPSNAWSTKYRLIACMSVQITSNLRDESIKHN